MGSEPPLATRRAGQSVKTRPPLNSAKVNAGPRSMDHLGSWPAGPARIRVESAKHCRRAGVTSAALILDNSASIWGRQIFQSLAAGGPRHVAMSCQTPSRDLPSRPPRPTLRGDTAAGPNTIQGQHGAWGTSFTGGSCVNLQSRQKDGLCAQPRGVQTYLGTAGNQSRWAAQNNTRRASGGMFAPSARQAFHDKSRRPRQRSRCRIRGQGLGVPVKVGMRLEPTRRFLPLLKKRSARRCARHRIGGCCGVDPWPSFLIGSFARKGACPTPPPTKTISAFVGCM